MLEVIFCWIAASFIAVIAWGIWRRREKRLAGVNGYIIPVGGTYTKRATAADVGPRSTYLTRADLARINKHRREAGRLPLSSRGVETAIKDRRIQPQEDSFLRLYMYLLAFDPVERHHLQSIDDVGAGLRIDPGGGTFGGAGATGTWDAELPVSPPIAVTAASAAILADPDFHPRDLDLRYPVDVPGKLDLVMTSADPWTPPADSERRFMTVERDLVDREPDHGQYRSEPEPSSSSSSYESSTPSASYESSSSDSSSSSSDSGSSGGSSGGD